LTSIFIEQFQKKKTFPLHRGDWNFLGDGGSEGQPVDFVFDTPICPW